MKRWLIGLLCALTLTSLWGCKRTQKEPQPSETAPATGPAVQNSEPTSPMQTQEATTPSSETEPTVPAPVEEEPSLVALTLDTYRENDEAKDGAILFSFLYQDAVVSMPDNADAAEKINQFLADLHDAAATYAQEPRSWAQENYTKGNDWTAHYYETTFQPARLDEKIISLFGTAVEFTGGMHPETTLISYNFNSKTGKQLSLGDILTTDDMAQALYLKVLDKLEEFASSQSKSADLIFSEGYLDTVQEHFNLSHDSSESWYFTNKGICFYFSPYEIAPYAVGPIQVELSFEDLSGILQEDFYPLAPNFVDSFSINAAKENLVQTDSFDHVHSIPVDTEGESVALFTGSLVYNVRLVGGSWVDENNFQEEITYFAANWLDARDLLLIRTMIPDTMPNLRVSMQIGDAEYRTYFIGQSGEDGSILLLENQ